MKRAALSLSAPCWILLLALSFFLLPAPARTADEATAPPKEEAAKPAPVEKSSRTQHTLSLDGRTMPYTATAGTLVIRDGEGKAKASVFYIAYTKDGVKDPAERPVTFSFNGGPGGAAVWVHYGAFGPKVVERDPEGLPLPPPGRLIDNPDTILDATDLVFLDPVSTGFSRPAPGEDPKQFHGFQQDLDSVGEFIRLWTTKNQRWASPKFLAGESYGTIRASGLAAHLQSRYGLDLNGVILISCAMNAQNRLFNIGNDMPNVIFLPTYAITAWYHKKLAPELSDPAKLLAEVEYFATHEYATALMEGDRLAPAERRKIAERVARYTGLSADYVERSNLRIEIARFDKELLRDRGLHVGRLDSRFTGRDLDAAGEIPEFDPSLVGVDSSYTWAANDYVRRVLRYEDDAPYERLNFAVFPWSYEGYENRSLNVSENLRQAMTRNPHLKVLIASGLYDMATPYYEAVYAVDHMGLPPELRGNVSLRRYDAGHMMYVKKTENAKLKRDVVEFLRGASAR